MTISELSNKIFTFFLTKDTFSLEKDTDLFTFTKDQDGLKYSMVVDAMDSLEKKGIVTKIPVVDNVCWVLTSPLELRDQTIVISAAVAESIANLVNQYRESIGKHGCADKLNITEIDIQSVVLIAAEDDKATDHPEDTHEDDNV